MAKIIPKKVREKIIKLRDEEGLSWARIGQQTGLHRETVRKQYLLEGGEGVPRPIPEKAPPPSGQIMSGGSSVRQEFKLLAKRQKLLHAVKDYADVIESEEWKYVEDELVFLGERLDFLKAKAESAKDIDAVREIGGLLAEEMHKLQKLSREQAEAEKKSQERERERKLNYIKEYHLNRGRSKKEVRSLVISLAKERDIEADFELVKSAEAMECLRGQCFDLGIDSRFVEAVLLFSIPKVPAVAYVRQLWWDAQRISHQFGLQEFAWFWGWWARFTIQGRQSLWSTFLAWKARPQPVWTSYQWLPQNTRWPKIDTYCTAEAKVH